MNATKTIQKAIAMLVTHLYVAENYKDFRREVIVVLNLSEIDVEILDDFYEKNKENFVASARILQKNRWDDIKLSLPIIAEYIEKNRLDNIWNYYIRKNNLIEFPSKNPLAESIEFARFAENCCLVTQVEQQLIKYERIRNEVTYNHHENFVSYSFDKNVNVNEDNMDKLSVFIHMCYKIKDFDCDIIKMINKNNDEIKIDNYKVLFFKNLNKEGIGTLKITNDINDIIENLKIAKNLLETYCCYEPALTKVKFLQLLRTLKELGVLAFIENKEDI
jgi:predicted transcriptional regulator